MGPTALQIQSENQGKNLGAGFAEYRTGEYRGALTAARFSAPQAEWAELRSGCGIYDLGYRATISLTGSDRSRWLNGMVTNNIRDLAVGHGVYAFLLNPQGHILGDLYAYTRADSITIDTDRSQLDKILPTFDHYIIMDDVEVKNVSDDWTALGIIGPKARMVLLNAGLRAPDLQPLQLHTVTCDCDCGCVNCTIVRTDDPIEAYEIWLAPGEVNALWDALIKQGATPVGFEALELHRIASGVPLYGVDIHERDLPQETEQARALNFNKGCYVGQEIVERIRSRGAVHRKFSGFIAEAAASEIVSGARIVSGEKEIGEVTSAVTISVESGAKTIALGYIRREAGVPGREVMIADRKANVVQMPLDLSALSPQELQQHSA